MIKYETIISNFDDKVTLYNWLRKVEEALKNASATNFVVNKKGNATLSFSITFADGTTLESGDIVLQQGESVQSASIVDGHLILTLTNGNELDAGNLGAVSSFSIDANQHLIVTYQDGTTADLGAIFTGNVNIAGNLTADSIVENMSGYSFTANHKENLTDTGIYAGVVKNGNKITFVYFVQLNRSDSVSGGWATIGRFNIPHSVWLKLYPYTAGGVDRILACQVVRATKNQYAQGVNLPVAIMKNPYSDNIYFEVYDVNTLDAETDYFVRIEITFLLSDNLVGA